MKRGLNADGVVVARYPRAAIRLASGRTGRALRDRITAQTGASAPARAARDGRPTLGRSLTVPMTSEGRETAARRGCRTQSAKRLWQLSRSRVIQHPRRAAD